jgi:CMP-2-keto-3-deoxyoctulosonic acid synthetase
MGHTEMTYEEAREQAEERVYVDMTAGSIMDACDAKGFKFKKTRTGNFAGSERGRCEAFLIEQYTNQYMGAG